MIPFPPGLPRLGATLLSPLAEGVPSCTDQAVSTFLCCGLIAARSRSAGLDGRRQQRGRLRQHTDRSVEAGLPASPFRQAGTALAPPRRWKGGRPGAWESLTRPPAFPADSAFPARGDLAPAAAGALRREASRESGRSWARPGALGAPREPRGEPGRPPPPRTKAFSPGLRAAHSLSFSAWHRRQRAGAGTRRVGGAQGRPRGESPVGVAAGTSGRLARVLRPGSGSSLAGL